MTENENLNVWYKEFSTFFQRQILELSDQIEEAHKKILEQNEIIEVFINIFIKNKFFYFIF